MPYTPPSQQSPATSQTSSPTISRSHSYHKDDTAQRPSGTSDRPGLPRSTSSSIYLSKHRRAPSITKSQPPLSLSGPKVGSPTSNVTISNVNNPPSDLDPHGSLRQSPPPVNNALIPTGAIPSPPESTQNSSDDEDSIRGRIRDLGPERLGELQAAIRSIEQRREGSPDRVFDTNEKVQMALNRVAPELVKSVSSPALSRALDFTRLPLSKEARKISHSRSSTDSSILLDVASQVMSPVQMTHGSEEDESDESELSMRPSMVRKKSGELVKPALRPSSVRRRPSSMPGTPTYSKAVHFDANLEHVRHFLQVERPLAVSAGSSPVDSYESELEFPFGNEDMQSRGAPFEWEIKLPNFPPASEDRKHQPVRVERIYLSSDKKNLLGAIAVQNLAFHKHVTARFTLDYWKTTSEVTAEFNNDVRKKYLSDGCDRFLFSIKIADQANLENKTLFFCIRYCVNGQEYWDNNKSLNYQVDFTKKAVPQMGKNGMSGATLRPLNSLPRSRPSPPVSNARPVSAPSSFDDFSSGLDDFSSFDRGRSPISMIGESPIKLRGPQRRDDLVPDAPTRKQKAPNPQAFGNRYDFGASMKAAMDNATLALKEKSGLRQKEDRVNPITDQVHDSKNVTSDQVTKPSPEVGHEQSPNGLNSKPAALVSEKPSHQSQSYQELVNKYCFFGSAKPSPHLRKSITDLTDGANDGLSNSESSSGQSSTQNSPVPEQAPRFALHEQLSRQLSPPNSRSMSPTPVTSSEIGSRSPSPASFGYPYRQSMQNGILSDGHAPTAIKG